MKIGTLTYHRNQNYGGILQAYALQQVILGLGYETEILDYSYPGWEEAFNRKKEQKYDQLWKYNMKLKLQNLIYGQALKQRQERTLDFLQHYLLLSKIRYENYAHLEKEFRKNHDYGAVVCGSDQIWNPGYKHADDAFYLRFVVHGLRISYAGSFGVSKLPESYINERKEDFNRFDAISVREDVAVSLVAQMTDKKIYHVLDPTLLLTNDQWTVVVEKAAKVKLPSRYIACYFLNDIRKNYFSYLEAVARQYNLPIVSIGYHIFPPKKWLYQVSNAGPLEFLYILRNSSSVITDSFHGTVFSVIFKKNFVSFASRKDMSSRLYSLLSLLKLDNNNYLNNVDIPHVDYDSVMDVLNEKRAYSRNFLTQSLSLNM